MSYDKYQEFVKNSHLAKIAEVKELIDYILLSSIIVALALASLTVIGWWIAAIYIALVMVYQIFWSNEAIIKKFENLDCTYEFNERAVKGYEYNSDDDSKKIAFDAACAILENFDEVEIIDRSGEQFYDELLSIVNKDTDLTDMEAA